MELYQLKYFLAIADTQGFTESCRTLVCVATLSICRHQKIRKRVGGASI